MSCDRAALRALGGAGLALLVAVVTVGQPSAAVESEQVAGPRGTGVAVQELSGQAEQLADMVAFFVVDDSGRV